MKENNVTWLLRKQYEEYMLQLRTTWDLYLKFYTVFLTINVIGLGATVQHITQANRWPVVLAFIVQNLVSSITAIRVGFSAKTTQHDIQEVSNAMVHIDESKNDYDSLKEVATKSPIQTNLALWAGIANFISHITLIICWLAVLWIPSS